MRNWISTVAILGLSLAPLGCGGAERTPAPDETGSAGETTMETSAQESTSPPEVGSAAPPFSLPGSDGRTHSLEDHLGKRAVVLAWFPKAFTGG